MNRCDKCKKFTREKELFQVVGNDPDKVGLVCRDCHNKINQSALRHVHTWACYDDSGDGSPFLVCEE